jgi:Fe-S cluster assembly protein SufB
MSSTHETDGRPRDPLGLQVRVLEPDDAKDYFFKSGGACPTSSSKRSPSTRPSPSGCGSSGTSRSTTSRAADAVLGSRPLGIDFENIYYYIKPTEKQADTWEDLPSDIKDTWDKLGIPEAEKKYLAGVGAQYESEVVYHKLQADLESKGVLFLDMDSGLREHEELVKQYMGTIIPQNDNKFAALNSAVWSGGSFIYVPPGVRIEMPLQAYFRINAENMGQFERTLIIVDEDAYVHYVEGCTAPIYSSDSLHSAVVEIVVKRGGRCRYTTIQNWSNNVYNLVTKRAVAYEDATMEWVDGNLGSKVTMKYPAIWLMGERAHGEVLSIAFGGKGQHQDAGGKVVHVAPRTSSVITSKSISKDGGRAGYRGLLQVANGAVGSKSKVVCDALILDDESRSTRIRTSRSTSRTSSSGTRRRSRRSARSSSSIS